MIDIAKIVAEGVASTLGLAATYRGPGLAGDAPGLPVSIVPSDADASVELGKARLGREAIRFRVYGAGPDLKKTGRIVRAADGLPLAGEAFELTGDGEAADRGRQSWFASVKRVGP